MPINSNSVLPFVSGPILKRLKWSWLGYGAAAYAGLYLLRRFGIFEQTADKGMKLIERGANLATGGAVGRARPNATTH